MKQKVQCGVVELWSGVVKRFDCVIVMSCHDDDDELIMIDDNNHNTLKKKKKNEKLQDTR